MTNPLQFAKISTTVFGDDLHALWGRLPTNGAVGVFDVAGSYPFVCTPHQFAGTITVAAQ